MMLVRKNVQGTAPEDTLLILEHAQVYTCVHTYTHIHMRTYTQMHTYPQPYTRGHVDTDIQACAQDPQECEPTYVDGPTH